MGTSLSGKDSYSLSLRITPSCGRTVAPTRRVVSYRHDRGVPARDPDWVGTRANAICSRFALFRASVVIELWGLSLDNRGKAVKWRPSLARFRLFLAPSGSGSYRIR